MVELALLIGIFGNLVLGLGILGGLGPPVGGVEKLGILGGLGVLGLVVWGKKRIGLWLKEIWDEIKKDRLFLLLVGLFLLQAIVNLIGALGPELGFDALWYHLTIPKIYLQHSRIFFIPGGLYYYSTMPKLIEMLYLVSLNFSAAGVLAKLIHFSFGVLTAAALYNLGRRYLKPKWAMLTVLLFYATLIVGWQSTTAYVDLGRTFFELLALDLFLQWRESPPSSGRAGLWKSGIKKLVEAGIVLGLAISTKLLALATLPVFLILIYFRSRKISLTVYYWLLATFIPLPWLVFSALHTGNPIYPVFSKILDANHQIEIPNIFNFFRDTFSLFFHSPDPISPVFLIFLPVVVWLLVKGSRGETGKSEGAKKSGTLKSLTAYIFLTTIFWYLTPRTGGSRFILPYLPAWSLLIVWLVSFQKKFYPKTLIFLIILSSLVNLGYRSLANAKYLPVLFGRESKDKFLSKNLNYGFGDFYDIDDELKRIIRKEDLILVYGGHNLFYLNFPFIHESFAKRGTYFSYILVQSEDLPKKFGEPRLVYKNLKTGVRLYLFGRQLP